MQDLSTVMSVLHVCSLHVYVLAAVDYHLQLGLHFTDTVHAARERPCDITRKNDCFRYSVLGRLFSPFTDTVSQPRSMYMHGAA